MKPLRKYFQRRLYTYLNTWIGFSSFVLLLTCFCIVLLTSLIDPCQLFWVNIRSHRPNCAWNNFADNIGNLDLEADLSYGSIDVVYTWVNGSDPQWLARKEAWSKDKFANATNITVTGFNGTSSNDSSSQTDNDDTMSINRYRDSSELRYSLRSLVVNAPWVRHIYIVTDNQIPSWLNLDTDHLSVVSHSDIFSNKSHLPVFSSPAIEAHLHRIPGLSKRFIYFNDDVFLGSPVLPEDFVSVRGTQRFYMSWDVPKCAPGCSDSWIGDGYCDTACNVSSCNFDFPDCINGTNLQRNGATTPGGKPNVYCVQGCPDSWLGDRVCDMRCKTVECGWDMGDCGIPIVTEAFPGVTLAASHTALVHGETNGTHIVSSSKAPMVRFF